MVLGYFKVNKKQLRLFGGTLDSKESVISFMDGDEIHLKDPKGVSK